jgi:mRNA-degrading endonuclease toxin of MazEF toxin-antitoxin module
MSNDSYNSRFEDFIAIPITSNPHMRDHTIEKTTKELESGSIPMASSAKVDRIFSLQQKLIRRQFGRLRQDVFDSIKRELLRIID